MIFSVILVMDGWVDPCKPNATRNPLHNPELVDEVLMANPDSGSQIPAQIEIDEDDMIDIRELAEKGIRPLLWLVEVK